MKGEPYDIDELAAKMRNYTERESEKRMPGVVVMNVEDASMRSANGWVICRLENRIVRCMVPGNWDLSVGVLLAAFPPSSPGMPYWAFGAFGATTIDNNTYVPRITAPNVGASSDNNVSNPPSAAQLITAFGTAADAGDGFLGLLDDSGSDANVYLCASNGTSWWYVALTKAT